jgi:hypothetical protein
MVAPSNTICRFERWLRHTECAYYILIEKLGILALQR